MTHSADTPVLDIQLPMSVPQIRQLLPQRYPMLLVDRVIALEPGVSITAIKNITANEPFFDGHFPNYPLMPGVLMIEAMAQAAGILGFVSSGKRPSDGFMYLFAGADRVRFKRQVVPGDQLVMTAKWLLSRHGIHKFACRAHVDDELAASVEVLIAEHPMEAI